MKKILALIAIVIIIVLAGYFLLNQQTQRKDLGTITFGWNTWVGTLPFLVAYDKGFYKEEGLNVVMPESQSYSQILDDLISGKVDFVGDIALIDIVKQVSNGEKLKAVLATDFSAGADGIVVRKDIKYIVDLKGKKVAVEKGTLGEHLLYDALKKNGLNLADVQEVDLSAENSAQAFIDGKVDAAVAYEPDLSRAVKEGDGNLIFSTIDTPGLITDILTFKSDYVANNPEKVAAVTRSYFKAIDFIIKNPDEANEIGAKYFKITPAEFKNQSFGIKQLGLADNLRLMPYGGSAESIHRLIQQAYAFLKIKGTVDGPVDSTEIVAPQFVRDLIK